jgi:hypothetical protein
MNGRTLNVPNWPSASEGVGIAILINHFYSF